MKKILFFTLDSNKQHLKTFINIDNYDIKILDTNIETIKNLYKEKEYSETLAISDNIHFLQIIFRLYNQTFDNFIYISNDKNSENIDFDIYNIFLITEICETENISNSIYVLGKIPEKKLNINFNSIKKIDDTKSTFTGPNK